MSFLLIMCCQILLKQTLPSGRETPLLIISSTCVPDNKADLLGALCGRTCVCEQERERARTNKFP